MIRSETDDLWTKIETLQWVLFVIFAISVEEWLIKEHRYNLSFNDVRSTSGSKYSQEDILIYPKSKVVTQNLDTEQGKRNLWMAIGHSFRDIIIRTMF